MIKYSKKNLKIFRHKIVLDVIDPQKNTKKSLSIDVARFSYYNRMQTNSRVAKK